MRDKPKPKPKLTPSLMDGKLGVHYRNGIDDARNGFRPTWFNDEETEWKSAERDAYRAGYRTVNTTERKD